MKTKYRYIHFEESEGFFYKAYLIKTNRGNKLLGSISWYADWGEFVFEGKENCIFNVGCMNDIIHFISQLKRTNNEKTNS